MFIWMTTDNIYLSPPVDFGINIGSKERCYTWKSEQERTTKDVYGEKKIKIYKN